MALPPAGITQIEFTRVGESFRLSA